MVHFNKKLPLRKRPSQTIFARIDRQTLSLTVFTQSNFVADFLQPKGDYTRKTVVLRFETPLGNLGTTDDIYLRLIGKRVVDFLLLLLNFFAICYG